MSDTPEQNEATNLTRNISTDCLINVLQNRCPNALIVVTGYESGKMFAKYMWNSDPQKLNQKVETKADAVMRTILHSVNAMRQLMLDSRQHGCDPHAVVSLVTTILNGEGGPGLDGVPIPNA